MLFSAGDNPMRAVLAGLAFVLAGLSQAVAAPAPDIVGKSVLVNWTETQQIQRADGSATVAVSRELRVYISSAGRSFARLTAAAGRRSATNEQVGNSGTSLAGGAQAVRVDGRTVVMQSSYGNWARNVRVELSPGGSSCSAQVNVGKEVGSAPKAFRSGLSGMMTEIHSVTVSSASCTVQQGNVFAN
jgi:hypothetical protein